MRIASRLWQLFYFRRTGEVWSPSLAVIGRPTWAWVRSGRTADMDLFKYDWLDLPVDWAS